MRRPDRVTARRSRVRTPRPCRRPDRRCRPRRRRRGSGRTSCCAGRGWVVRIGDRRRWWSRSPAARWSSARRSPGPRVVAVGAVVVVGASVGGTARRNPTGVAAVAVSVASARRRWSTTRRSSVDGAGGGRVAGRRRRCRTAWSRVSPAPWSTCRGDCALQHGAQRDDAGDVDRVERVLLVLDTREVDDRVRALDADLRLGDAEAVELVTDQVADDDRGLRRRHPRWTRGSPRPRPAGRGRAPACCPATRLSDEQRRADEDDAEQRGPEPGTLHELFGLLVVVVRRRRRRRCRR